MFIFILLLSWLASIAIPFLYYRFGVGKVGRAARAKRSLAVNIIAFIIIAAAASVFIFTGRAFAAETGGGVSDFAMAAAFIGAGLVTGLSCIGTGLAVGPAATAAIGAISENESVMGKALIFVAMAEGIAIYGLLVSFMILGRV